MRKSKSILRAAQPLRTRTVRLPADLHERLSTVEEAAQNAGLSLPVDELVARALRGVVRDAEAELREAGALPAEDGKADKNKDGKTAAAAAESSKPAGATTAAGVTAPAENKPQPETKPAGVSGLFGGRSPNTDGNN